MSHDTHTHPARTAVTRPAWRDGIKVSTLSPTTRLVALLMADYWPHDAESPDLWCAVATLREQSGLSRATVYRAFTELQEWGWLIQIAGAAQHRSPRYRPMLGVQRSHPETAEVAQGDAEVSSCDPKPQDSPRESTDGPSDTGLPGGRELRPRRTKRTLSQEKLTEEWLLLKDLMAAEGMDDNPYDVWYTLVAEHKARTPGSFMQARIESGEWDGFLGSHGIGDYSHLHPA